jgi:hypothetical protein
MLKKIYGEMIIKKDTILYHTSDEPYHFKSNQETPMLFCTFHPFEYGMAGDYVCFVRIKKDINLLFMVEDIKKVRIYSALSTFINHPNANLAKKHKKELYFFSEQLKKENLDGWFSSIENKGTVEVALINNNSLYEIMNCDLLKNNNNKINNKNWGNYNIYTIKNPIILNINERFKDILEKYKDYCIKENLVNNYIFEIILMNAEINYHKYPYQKIDWNKDR